MLNWVASFRASSSNANKGCQGQVATLLTDKFTMQLSTNESRKLQVKKNEFNERWIKLLIKQYIGNLLYKRK